MCYVCCIPILIIVVPADREDVHASQIPNLNRYLNIATYFKSTHNVMVVYYDHLLPNKVAYIGYVFKEMLAPDKLPYQRCYNL